MKRYVITLAAIAALLTAGGCGNQNTGSDVPAQEVYQDIVSTDKLVFATMTITKTIHTERKEWYKIGKRIAAYSYDSYLRAYIDMTDFKPSDVVYDDDKRQITIYLPRIEVESAGRDMNMRKVYENIGPLRSDLDSRERAEMKEKANTSLRQELAGNPEFKQKLTAKAQQKARMYFKNILSKTGYDIVVDFKS